MCGICGIIGKTTNKRKYIKIMADKINHRGPDGEGYYVDKWAALGHKRLSIIDIENGTQPMFDIDKNIVVVFNGEIYNYKELREELISKNYEFRTNSDTEVLVNGYLEWGFELSKHLRGMFAYAIYDKRKKLLFASRDPFGIKPLYYFQDEEMLLFASEIKSIISYPHFDKKLNKDALNLYFKYSFVPSDETLFKDIYELDGGCNMIYQDDVLKIDKYYDISVHKENYKKLESILDDSIKIHQISDVEVASFLSSGIDSAYIASKSDVKQTFTVGYDVDKYNESNIAKNIAEYAKIKNKTVNISKEEYMDAFKSALYYMDEPLTDPAAISLYVLTKEASKHVKVCLSGEGADEFFGGYNSYQAILYSSLYNKIPYFIRNILAKLAKNIPEVKGKNFIIRNGSKLEDYYVGVSRLFDEYELKKLFKNKPNKDDEIVKNILNGYEEYDDLIKMQIVDTKLWLRKDILRKADRMSMANSLEVRVPYVDKYVFENAIGMPMDKKINKNTTKLYFRKIVSHELPDFANKKKLGFPVPLRDWIKDDDIFEDIKATFSEDYVQEFFNQKYILKLLKDHKNGKKDNYKKIWSIYSFLKWYELYFDDIIK